MTIFHCSFAFLSSISKQEQAVLAHSLHSLSTNRQMPFEKWSWPCCCYCSNNIRLIYFKRFTIQYSDNQFYQNRARQIPVFMCIASPLHCGWSEMFSEEQYVWKAIFFHLIRKEVAWPLQQVLNWNSSFFYEIAEIGAFLDSKTGHLIRIDWRL